MNNDTIICADIAKNIFQVAMFRQGQQISQNRSYKRVQFERLIQSKLKRCIWVMESCSGAQHWGRLIRERGQQVVLLSPRFVSKLRQGQKTDANDVLAIFDAYRSAQMKPCPLKSIEQQGLQTLERVREHYQTHKVRLSNAIRGHLSEFGLVLPTGYKHLRRKIPLILEDDTNGLPYSARMALSCYWEDWQAAVKRMNELTRQIDKVLSNMSVSKSLLKLEGVGPVCVSGLICALGDGAQIQNAKQAAAFIGTSPKAHSSGGNRVIVGISKKTGHKRLRSALIQGARSMIIRVKQPNYRRSELVQWLLPLIERVGENRAAVALANKNVRRAYAILRQSALS